MPRREQRAQLARSALKSPGHDCACSGLRRAARAVTQMYDDALKPSGLQATQLPVLVESERLGPVPISRLADVLVMDRTTLTRNLRPLERDGLMVAAPGVDGRVRMVRLTAKGRRVLSDAYPRWAQAQSRLTRRLGRARLRHLVTELAAMVEAARDADDRRGRRENSHD